MTIVTQEWFPDREPARPKGHNILAFIYRHIELDPTAIHRSSLHWPWVDRTGRMNNLVELPRELHHHIFSLAHTRLLPMEQVLKVTIEADFNAEDNSLIRVWLQALTKGESLLPKPDSTEQAYDFLREYQLEASWTKEKEGKGPYIDDFWRQYSDSSYKPTHERR